MSRIQLIERRLRVGASAAAMAAAFAMLGGEALAQDSGGAVESIVVTGFRGSLNEALNIKRNSVGSVDSVLAEDIADFPDLNLGESIQRIPGVALARDAGEGRQITVRGLGPQFTRVRINGMEALSTTGGTDAAGGTNRGRAFDFNIFASDLFNSITVRKTASAEVEEGSLGATVDLRASRPFDYDGFTLAASGQYGYNDLSEEYDPRGAFLVSNTWNGGKFGALFSIAYAERNLLEEGASTVRWQNSTAANNRYGSVLGASCVPAQTGNCATVNSSFHPRIPRYDIYTHAQERLGVTGSLQWQPSESTLVSVDMLYSKFSGTRQEVFLESQVFSTNGGAGLNDVDVLAFEIQGNSLVFGQFNDVDIRSENRLDELSTEYTQITGEFSHEFSSTFRIGGLAGWAESDHQNPVQTTLLFDHANVDGYVYDYRQNNRLPLFTYGAVDVTDPASWTLSQIRLRPQTAVNTYTALQGHAEWDADDWLTFKGGIEWKKYEFVSTERRRSNGTTSNQEAIVPAFAAATPITSYSLLATLTGRGLDIPAGNTNTWLIPDVAAAAALWDLYNEAVFPMGIQPALGNNASIEEEDTGGYVQADFETELLGMPLRGNVGVRYVETQQTSTGYTFTSGAPLLVTVERTYDDLLPSGNLVLSLSDDFLVRFGASKVMTRPGLGSLSPGAAVSVSGANFSVTAGNPLLDPFRATAVDLAFEWYYAQEALFSVALFYKDIETLVQTVRQTIPFTGNPLGLPDSVAIAACGAAPGCSPAAIWNFNIPANTPGGELQGFEISWQQPFDFLPAPFDHFGALANYTYVETEVAYVNATGAVVATDDLTGLSRRSYNATLYYEDDMFSARISAAFRNKYPTTIPGRNGNTIEAAAETFNLDFASSLAVAENVKITFEALNLTDEVNDQYLDPDSRSSFYHHYGRQFFVGFRYTN